MRRVNLYPIFALSFLISFTNSGCGLKQPKPDLCSIVNTNVAQCSPTDLSKPEYDKPLNEMLGYVCLSAKDFGDLTAYISAVLSKLEQDQLSKTRRINAK